MTAPNEPETHPTPTPAPPEPTPEPHSSPGNPGLEGLEKRVDDLEAIVTALVQQPDTTPASKPWTRRKIM